MNKIFKWRKHKINKLVKNKNIKKINFRNK